jgi:hypothetical protein
MSDTDQSGEVIGNIFLRKVNAYGEGKLNGMLVNKDLIRDIIGYNPKTDKIDEIDSSQDIINHINQELDRYCSSKSVGTIENPSLKQVKKGLKTKDNMKVIKPTYDPNTPVILAEEVQQTPTPSPNKGSPIEQPPSEPVIPDTGGSDAQALPPGPVLPDPVELPSASQPVQPEQGTDGSDAQAPPPDQGPQVELPSASSPVQQDTDGGDDQAPPPPTSPSSPPPPPVQQIPTEEDTMRGKLLGLSMGDLVMMTMQNGFTKTEVKAIRTRYLKKDQHGVWSVDVLPFKEELVNKILEKEREKAVQSPAVNPGGGGIKRKKYSKRRRKRKSSKRKKTNKRKSKRKYKRKYSKRVR